MRIRVGEYDDDDVDARLGPHWNGNTAAPGAAFTTDGHTMFLKEAVHSWAMPLLSIRYWDVRPEAPEEACRAIFDKAVAAATVPCVFGWCRRHGEGEEWFLEVLREDGVSAWLGYLKALLVSQRHEIRVEIGGALEVEPLKLVLGVERARGERNRDDGEQSEER